MTQITHVCIFKNRHHSYSDVFGSRKLTAYQIGRPDGSPMKLFNIALDEAESIVTHLPDELLDVVKEHYELVNKKEVQPIGVESALTSNIEHMKSMKQDELKELCKSLDVKNYSKMAKETMIENILATLLNG